MEVKGHFKCFGNLSKKVVLKVETIAKCFVVSSHVLTIKHEAEQQLLTWRQFFKLLQETNKHSHLAYSVPHHILVSEPEMTPLNIWRLSHLFK